MRFTKKMLFALAFLCFVFAFTPVGEALGTNSVEDVQAAVTLNKTEITLRPAYTYTLKVSGYTDKVVWRTTNANVAVVNKNGKVTSKAVGTATIKAKDLNNNILGTCVVNVSYGSKTYNGVKYKDIQGKTFGTTGRWYSYASSTFTNANGSSFYFRVAGTNKVRLNFFKNTKKLVYYAYSINGGAYTRSLITDNTNIITLPSTGVNFVKVVIDSIATTEDRYNNTGVGIRSVDPYDTTYGAVCGIIPDDKRIAFYGDSITEGVNAIGRNYDSASNSAINSYAWYTAERLKATPVVCGYASTGIVATGKTEAQGKVEFAAASTAIRRYSKTKAVGSYDSRVKVVVLEYGTNDSTLCDASKFKTMYSALLTQVRGAYPNALIVCVTPFHYTERNKFTSAIVAAAKGMSNVQVFDTKAQGISDRFSGYADSLHPRYTEARDTIAPKLAAFIKQYSNDF